MIDARPLIERLGIVMNEHQAEHQADDGVDRELIVAILNERFARAQRDRAAGKPEPTPMQRRARRQR